MNQDINKESNIKKVALTSLAGTSIEWYDFFLYGAAAGLVFPKLFFGEASPTTALILSFLTFAAGFIARPVGGIIFGHFGDLIGRKKTLVIALMLMGVSSTLIGFSSLGYIYGNSAISLGIVFLIGLLFYTSF